MDEMVAGEGVGTMEKMPSSSAGISTNSSSMLVCNTLVVERKEIWKVKIHIHSLINILKNESESVSNTGGSAAASNHGTQAWTVYLSLSSES